ncbi:hypothetical protein P152DRAFT_481262 [Eremomyces bilateralis CBS 781.70]|uniref:Myb-like DNA-binding domain-containing protein n=1 Tax=Eremomyces bilateralis CBS 781.70 TaxID=1392243 RepID=A0A6G1G522_9PEZI|nr:uncharacterized protein P152DRAFT_481262 [Eremomyces bilateralis CBS 781.70]KAF1813118.1 hypothetical protein P152DRAFT_481262 [Eremomyces bilateralis CBS 781.70]
MLFHFLNQQAVFRQLYPSPSTIPVPFVANMPTDKEMAQFCYSMLRQLDLKIIDWNEVARRHHITNGHAARMRFSRFRQQMEGTLPRRLPTGNPRGRPPRRPWGEEDAYLSKTGGRRVDAKGMPESDDEDVPIWLVSEERKRRLRVENGTNGQWTAFKSEPLIKSDPMQVVPSIPAEHNTFAAEGSQSATLSPPGIVPQSPFMNILPAVPRTETMGGLEPEVPVVGMRNETAPTVSTPVESEPIQAVADHTASTQLPDLISAFGGNQEQSTADPSYRDSMPPIKRESEADYETEHLAVYARIPTIKQEIAEEHVQQDYPIQMGQMNQMQMPLVRYDYPRLPTTIRDDPMSIQHNHVHPDVMIPGNGGRSMDIGLVEAGMGPEGASWM